jgi:DNA modification methylase
VSLAPYLDDGDVRLYAGDCVDVLAALPAASVDCVVTSPPYWGLRDYGVNGQIGLEEAPDAYVERLVGVFREVRRVLAPHGTCWVNLGSSFYGGEADPIGLTEADAAWLAALIDGEGSIQIHRQARPIRANSVDSFQVDVSVGMVTPEMVHRAHHLTRLGTCKQDRRGVWYWSVRGQQAATILRLIYPWIVGKRGQAAIACMVANDLASRRFGRGNPATPESMDFRQRAKQAVSDLNQRRGTDFPISDPKVIPVGLKPKDDVMIPARVARALQADGWWLRSDVIWAKPNPMPESVADRPTKAHEYVFLLTKAPQYFWDAEAVREKDCGRPSGNDFVREHRLSYGGRGERHQWLPSAGRNVRSVWTIATQPTSEAHFATFPEALVERCLKAGCANEVCRTCGEPRRPIIETTRTLDGAPLQEEHRRTFATPDQPFRIGSNGVGHWRYATERRVLGLTDCGHGDYRVGVVLDPFVGSGTTALVARKLGLRGIGVDLNADYLDIAAKRLQQLSLFGSAA